MSYITNILKRFAKDESANMTLEFIIITPVLITWWVGSVVFFDAYDARSGAARVSHTIADLVSRQTEVNNAFIDDMLTLQNRMLPFEPVGVIRITQLYQDIDGNLSIEWSYATNGIDITDLDDIPMSIMPPLANEQYIMLVESNVPYIPMSRWVGIEAQTWINQVYINARFVDQIPNTDITS